MVPIHGAMKYEVNRAQRSTDACFLQDGTISYALLNFNTLFLKNKNELRTK